jgi:hypothetical protein
MAKINESFQTDQGSRPSLLQALKMVIFQHASPDLENEFSPTL